MLIQVFFQNFHTLSVVFFELLALSFEILLSLLFHFRQLLLEFKLNIQELIDYLGIHFLQGVVRNFVKTVYLVGVIGVYSFIAVFALLSIETGLAILFFFEDSTHVVFFSTLVG